MPAKKATAITPFVLLDDARAQDASDARLYENPVRIITAHDSAELHSALKELDRAQAAGLHAAGYFSYEAGYALEQRLEPLLPANSKALCWFAFFESYRPLVPHDIPAWLAERKSGEGAVYNAAPDISFPAYHAAYAEVQRAIRAGDIYQANLTYKLAGQYAGDPFAIYAAYRASAGAGYGGMIYDGTDWLLSFSPELFFTAYRGEITARPMKGTVQRHANPAEDDKAVKALQANEKDRAENLMIVDLLRNDISRVAETGSVHVPHLFAIESYPTVHQMTSTVKARLAKDKTPADILRAIYPCGSITGAPKIRAMETLAGLERSPRGPYCGSMGRIDADGDAAFNVAIRTLRLDTPTKTATMGLGSAIVADSDPVSEWRECALKGAFLTGSMRKFDLIETMAFDPASGILRLEMHLERIKASAAVLGFEFDRHAARNQIQAACFHIEHAVKVRLMLGKAGAVAIEMQPMPKMAKGPMKVFIAPLPVESDDFRLRHKTSDRDFYDNARRTAQAQHGTDEVIFTDAKGRLTEGSFTHIFVGDAKAGYRTPPLELGLLPGILRREMLENGTACEAALTSADLEQGFYIGNSLRGLMQAQFIAP
ncbi:aminodeoxychorismate synthase component I [Sphingorhabdus sp. Alg239-R122]|uniref:aminodeoxychorismate synthase component I n=1 Tax=Sphingorhabdus sp. Alg239-R122 TaxID=2305989 RepID=UPI0013DCCD10|nr:aminodeoxychorismate synthase component I [Sphingorhabdus sp. Alg239-R122]